MAGSWWAERTGRPWVQLCCTVLTLPSRALAPFGLALQPDDSWRGRIRNRLLRAAIRAAAHALAREAEEAGGAVGAVDAIEAVLKR